MPHLSPSAGCVLVLTLLFSQAPRAGAGALAHSRAAPCPPGAATAGCGASACAGAACAGGAGSADGGARLRDPLFQPSLLGHLAPAGAAPSTAQPLLGFFRRLFGGAAGRGDGTSRKLLGERKERGHRLQDEARLGDALFHAGVPEFEASGFAKRAADGVASDCRALGADRVAPAYRSLDRVFVFDWAGVDANGLGNSASVSSEQAFRATYNGLTPRSLAVLHAHHDRRGVECVSQLVGYTASFLTRGVSQPTVRRSASATFPAAATRPAPPPAAWTRARCSAGRRGCSGRGTTRRPASCEPQPPPRASRSACSAPRAPPRWGEKTP